MATSTFNFDAIASLRDSGITVNNHMSAVSIAQDFEGTQQEFEDRIFKATGLLFKMTFREQARMFFINLVDDIVDQYSRYDEVDVTRSVEAAKKRTSSYFDVFTSKNPTGLRLLWNHATPAERARRIDELAKTHTRPASKQDRAVEIVKANPKLSNKELQAMFREQLGLTPNGAATYVYNVRKIISAL